MPNKRGEAIEPLDLEQAKPWTKDRFDGPEPQERRGEPGSRGVGEPVRRRERHTAAEWCGVNPLPPILDSMPNLKPGDQGG